jgi:signal transduction histidine kinase
VGAIYFDLDGGTDNNVRRFVAFPGGLLSGVGLIIYSHTVRSFSARVAGNFILAGVCMIFYALFTGIIPSDVIVPVIELKIILLRGGSAFLIMLFTIRALSVFSLEQRKLVNDKLQRFAQSEKLTSMGVLAAGIAHEINNPLTNVALNLEMLRDMVGGDENINKKLDSIERNVSRASTIARELLHFSREKETALIPTDINQVLLSTKNLLKNQFNSPVIQMRLNDVPEIMGIAWKLEEVFINLLMNSIDACQEEDIIEVETSCNSTMVQVVITDTGHGINEEIVSQVFDPFFTTKEVGMGTGLGLSICYNIIKQHGGDITLVSSEMGGTVITTTFPVIIDE